LLKRKYERLEEQSDDEHQLLELLRSAYATDAMQVLRCLRSGDDTQSVIDFARDLTLAGSAFSNTILQDQNDEDNSLLVASNNTISAAITDVLPPGARDPVAERYEQIGSASVSQIDYVSLLPSFALPTIIRAVLVIAPHTCHEFRGSVYAKTPRLMSYMSYTSCYMSIPHAT